ncbi:MAG: zinc dependent phospholipase C family protein [Clostridia bacterium]|nr:zinc dependent phospholipase C family protein [Clostridia bacterium]
MPASYVHQSIALAALKKLGDSLTVAEQSAWLSGCEGPDPFFFSFFRPGRANYLPFIGTRLHRTCTDTFLLTLCTGANTPVLRAYCYGFLSHYAADTVFHPYIHGHSLTKEGAYSSNLHGILEHQYEIIRFREDNGEGYPVQMAGIAALTDADKRQIAAHLTACIHAVFPEFVLSESKMVRTFNDSVLVCRLLRSEDGKKYSTLGRFPLNLDKIAHAHMVPCEPPDFDITNQAHAPWFSIFEPERERHESLDDLYETAVRQSCLYIEAARCLHAGELSGESFMKILGGLSYDSGLPWETTPPPHLAPGCRQPK